MISTDVKHFFKFSLTAIVLIVVIDFAAGTALTNLYDRMTSGEKARATYFIKNDTSDVIIFGSSRALYHYHSAIISKALKMSVYNGGRSNQGILYDLATLKSILKRHTPKLIILDVSEDELVRSEKKYEMLSALLPYCRYDQDIAHIYTVANPAYRFWSWSRTLPYNSCVFATIYRGLKLGKEQDKDINGFLSRDGVHRNELSSVNNCDVVPQSDQFLEESFLEFIRACSQRKIQLFISVSPRYMKYECERHELKLMKTLAGSQGTEIHDYTRLDLPGTAFSDPAHLNGTGAVNFTKLLVTDLKSMIIDKQ